MNFLQKLLEFLASLFGQKSAPTPPAPPTPRPVPPVSGPLSSDLVSRISALAAASPVATLQWTGRGVAPLGYTKGMVVTFGVVYRRWRVGDSAARLMAGAVVETPEHDQTDALSWYNSNFRAVGMSSDVAGADALGMRESSGRYCEGRDQSASNVTADTAESGLFQMSWDAHGASSEIPKLLDRYTADPTLGYLSVFREGVTPRPSDTEIFGSGDGARFQKTCKTSPSFSVEAAAVGLRVIRKHWGPINRKEAQIRTEVDDLLRQVQALVDGSQPSTQPSRPAPSVPVAQAQWPRESTPGALDAFYGNPRGPGGDVSPEWLAANMVKIAPPYPMTYEGKTVELIFVHRKCAESLRRIFRAIWDHYGHDLAKIRAAHLDEFDGSFNYRTNRNDPSKLSTHSYGIAIDLAAKWNPNGKIWQPNSGMIPLDVVRIFAAEGWAWGGQFNGTKDAMHFQGTLNIHADEALPVA